MKLTRFVIESNYGGYNKPEKLEALATFTGPFGQLSTKLSDVALARVVECISVEAAATARLNAQGVETACDEVVKSNLALTHEADA